MNFRNVFIILIAAFGVSILTGQEIHTDANAASVTNETDGTAGWTGEVNLTSVSTNPAVGDFALQIESTAAGRFASYSFNATQGVRYAIRIWTRMGAMVSNPSSAAIVSWAGLNGLPTTPIEGNNWTLHEYYVTAISTNPQIRIYTGSSNTNGIEGNTVFIDGFSITPAETEAPAAITDLSASNVTATSAVLSWSPASDNVGVTNYEVFQDGVSIGNTGTATTFSVTGLIPGSVYNFTVLAEDAPGNISESSNVLEVNTPSEINGGANATSIVNEANSIAGWTGNAVLSSVDTNPGDGNFALQVESSLTGIFAAYSFNATQGIRYAIRILARQGEMVSDPASPAFANWTGFAGFQDTPIIGTDWAAYTFYVTATAATPQIRVYTGAGGTAGTIGNTVFIDGVSITPAETEAPSAIADLFVANTTATSTELSWSAATDNIGVVNYEIFQDGVSIGNSGTTTNFEVNGLFPGTDYDFYVVAQDEAGNATSSNTVQISTSSEIFGDANAASIVNESDSTSGWLGAVNIQSVDTDPADGDFALQIQSTAAGRFATYSFSAVVGVRYAIRMSSRVGNMVSNPSSAAFVNWQGLNGLVTTPINSADWTAHEFYVTATSVNPQIRVYTGSSGTAGVAGNTVFIDAVSITPAETVPPTAVVDLSASNTTATGTFLSWSAATDNVAVTNYEVFRDGESIGNTGTATIFTVTGLLPGSTYNFTVVAEDAPGNTSASSNSVEVITPTEIHADANAASVENEADDTAGWISNAELTSVSTDPADGGFALQLVSTDQSQFAAYSFNANIGVRYIIQVQARQGAMVSDPPTSAFANWVGFDGFVTTPIESTDWTEYEFYVTATATTPQIRVYTGSAAASGTIGNTVLIDAVRITTAETVPPSTIADLAASNTTATTTQLSWSPSTDNVGVTNYQVFQDGISIGNTGTDTIFDVSGLIPGLEYSFTVIAQDIAGNSSASSNEALVTTESEVHAEANAASVVNEADATNGWFGDVTITSVDTNPSDGNFALQIESTENGRFASYTFNATVGIQYLIRLSTRMGNMVSNNSTPALANWQGLNGFVVTNINTNDWTDHEFYVTATSTNPELRVFTGGSSTEGVVGNTVFVDGVSITAAETEAPSSVVNLEANDITDTALVLTWSASTDNVEVVNYEIFQDGISIGNAGTNLNFSVTGLATATEYAFTVVAQDAAGNESVDNEVLNVTTIDTIVPSAVTNLFASNITDVSLELSWSAATDNVGVTNYEIFQGQNSIGNAGTELSFSVTGLTTATEYTFSVVAQDEAGNSSDISNSVVVTTLDSEAPSAVNDLFASDITDSSLTLNWSAVSDNVAVTDYELFRDGERIGNAGNELTFDVTGLATATEYTFTVVALDEAGNASEVSNAVVATTTDSEAPTAITDLFASDITDTSAVLGWSASTDNVGVVNYEIFQDGEGIASVGTDLTFSVSGLTNATEYTFTVVAEDEAGNTSEISNEVVVTTLDSEAPDAIEDLAASNITDISLDLSWSAATDNVGVVNYEIFQNGERIASVGTNLSYSITGLTTYTEYEFTVVAQDAVGNESAISNAVIVTTLDIIVPTAITDLAASNIADNSLDLSWSAASDNVGIVNYEVFQDGESIGNTGTNLSLSVTGLSTATEYTFTVVAQDAAGNVSEASNALVVTTADTQAPSAITDLAASNITDSSLDLSWSASEDNVGVVNYEVFQDGESIGSVGTDLTFSVSGLTTYTQYTFTVIALDQEGNASEVSNAVVVTTLDSEVPSPIIDLEASNITHISLDLSWSASTDNDGVVNYIIYQDGTEIGSTETDLSFSVTDLEPVTSYSFTVVAVDASGNASELNTELNVTTAPVPDSDGDGVNDWLDQCPDTPAGSIVDFNGCALFVLPADNFEVKATSASCFESLTGIISVSAENESYNYVVTVTDQLDITLTASNNFKFDIQGFAAGTYEVCFEIVGNNDFKQCFTVQISEPEPLEASSFVNLDDKTVSLNMSGSKEYIVSVNGKSRVTESSEITLDLEPGMNYIEVRTELECQGTYFEQIFVSEEVRVYPNPTMDWVQVYVSGTDSKVDMNLVDLNGNVLQRGSLDVPATREVALDLSQYPVGVYVIQLSGKTVNTSLKVIKH